MGQVVEDCQLGVILRVMNGCLSTQGLARTIDVGLVVGDDICSCLKEVCERGGDSILVMI